MTLPLLTELDKDQQKAVTFETGPLLVHAGPGTGKTRVLVSRMAFLIHEKAASPGQILAITFTNQAAGEISSRLQTILPPDTQNRVPLTCTFHGWAKRFLEKQRPGELPAIIDETEAAQIVSIAMRNSGIKGLKKRQVHKRISLLKQQWPPSTENESDEFVEIWERYHKFLREYNLMDYDDLILEANRILEQREAREELRRSLPFILVDEFQDVSPSQYSLVRLISPPDGNIMVIGDRHQSIYGFRGASPLFMDRFRQDFNRVTTISLKTCYRCPENFIRAAFSVVTPGDGMKMRARSTVKRKITLRSFAGVKSEASWIVREIERITGGLSFDSINAGMATGEPSESLGDIAILYRNSATGEPVARELEKRGIPFQHVKSRNPLASPDIRAIMRLWEISGNRRARYHTGILHKETGISPEDIRKFAQQHRNTSNPVLLQEIFDFLDIDSYAAEIQGLIKTVNAMPLENNLAILLQKEADALDINIEAVTLMSIHAAKGLEFPVIFITGCEDGIIPWHDGDPDEERRIFYVALSRASERLYITWSKKRLTYGRYRQSAPSPILSDIPGELLDISEQKRKKRPGKPKQLKLF